jgi:hypothetical protein
MAPKRRPGGLSLGLAMESDIKKQIEENYTIYKGLLEPLKIEEFNLIEGKLKPSICNNVIGKGDKKSIKECIDENPEKKLNVTYVVGSDNEEIMRHLILLKIYYENGDLSLGFKIPLVYLKFNENIEYYMDYIKIEDPESKKLGKFHYTDNPNILVNIGKILGLYANIHSELIYDFEIYKDENDGIYTLYGTISLFKEKS